MSSYESLRAAGTSVVCLSPVRLFGITRDMSNYIIVGRLEPDISSLHSI